MPKSIDLTVHQYESADGRHWSTQELMDDANNRSEVRIGKITARNEAIRAAFSKHKDINVTTI